MSFHTLLSHQEIQAFLNQYSLGSLKSFHGILDGVDNSNYQIETQQGSCILTLFEDHPKSRIEACFTVMTQLHTQGLPTAQVFNNTKGTPLETLKTKPAAILQFLEGDKPSAVPSLQQCFAIAQHLAKIHLALSNTAFPSTNTHHIDELATALQSIQEQIHDEDTALILTEQNRLETFQHQFADTLPQGLCHNDLFRDNTLFMGDRLTGLLDFYELNRDYWLYDLAVLINDWCGKESGHPCKDRLQACLNGYQSIRPLQDIEKQALTPLLSLSACVCFVQRLRKQIQSNAQKGVLVKDPDEFRQKLCCMQSPDFALNSFL